MLQNGCCAPCGSVVLVSLVYCKQHKRSGTVKLSYFWASVKRTFLMGIVGNAFDTRRKERLVCCQCLRSLSWIGHPAICTTSYRAVATESGAECSGGELLLKGKTGWCLALLACGLCYLAVMTDAFYVVAKQKIHTIEIEKGIPCLGQTTAHKDVYNFLGFFFSKLVVKGIPARRSTYKHLVSRS